MKKIRLCAIGDIEENTSKGFSVGDDDEQNIFVVRRDDHFYAYLNQCPHTGVTLNWQPDQFMDIEDFYIQCSVHGALFQVEDGLCVRGPCANQRLSALNTDIEEQQLFVSINAE